MIPHATKAEQRSLLVGEVLARRISYFGNVHLKEPTEETRVQDFLLAIRNGRWSPFVAAVQSALLTLGKKAADEMKCARLPAVTFAGSFDRRLKSALRQHSGLLILDFDSLGDDMESARFKLIAAPHVFAVFTSPSGCGLKALVGVDATDAESHTRCFQSAEGHFRALGLVADPTGKDVSRLCFASHDPDIWVREAGASVAILSAPCTICTTAPTAESASSASSARHREVLERRIQRNKLIRLFDDNVRLARIFRAFVESRPALKSQRNATLTKLVPALYSVVAEEIALRFSLAWFDLNQAVFKDTREQHSRETEAMLKGCAQSYLSLLPALVRAVYEALDRREQAAFRICRDLAVRSDRYVFFLSCDELGERLGCDSKQAHRILNGFAGDGILERITVGLARAPGVTARATEWKWLLD